MTHNIRAVFIALAVLTVVMYTESRKELTCINFQKGYTGSRGVWVGHPWVRRVPPTDASVACPAGWCAYLSSRSRLVVPRFASAFSAWSRFSVSFWYKTSVNATMTLLRNDQCSDEGAMHVYTFNGDRVVAMMVASEEDFAMTTASGADLDTWSHVAVTWNRRYMKIYLNGELQDKQSLRGSTLYNTKCPLMIGGRAYSKTMVPYDGYMDQICLYGRVLRPKEIKRLYRNP